MWVGGGRIWGGGGGEVLGLVLGVGVVVWAGLHNEILVAIGGWLS